MSDDGRNSSGLASALAQLVAPGADPGNGEAQLDIFEPDTPLPVKQKPRSGPQGGRPKGAMNRSTKEWVDYLLQRYRSPLVALMELYSRSPRELAEELGLYVWSEGKQVVGPKLDAQGRQVFVDGQPCFEPVLATGEAFKRQVEAMIAALPYTHQKLPLEIHTNDGAKGGLLVIGDLNVTANFGEEGLGLVTTSEPQTIDVTPTADRNDGAAS